MAFHLFLKKTIGPFFLLSLYLSSYVSSTFTDDIFSPALAPEPDSPVSGLTFENPRLEKAYNALQAMKRTIHSDPQKMTENWVGTNVCIYTGVTCARALDDPSMTVVAGLDLNQADIAGQIPPEIELLEDLGFLHINSNRFCGIVPEGISKNSLLFELDISNNRFVGPFPKAVLDLPGLKYLDIRFNNFEGPLPPELFEKDLDAIFVNNNRFTGSIPETLGKSPASVVVFANNKLSGCIPASIGNMTGLEQVLFSSNNLTGCLPEEMGQLASVEALDISDNNFKGDVPDSLCNLPKLANFSFANNYFIKVGSYCYSPLSGIGMNDTLNCLQSSPEQKPEAMCSHVVDINGAIDCSECSKQAGSKPSHTRPSAFPPSISLAPTSFDEASTAPTQAEPSPAPVSFESMPAFQTRPIKKKKPITEDLSLVIGVRGV